MIRKLLARAATFSVLIAGLSTLLPQSVQVANAQVDETFYGTARGWDIVSVSEYGDFLGCGMSRLKLAFDMTLGLDEYGAWQLGFPAASPDGTQITIDMDLDRYSDLLNATVRGGLANAQIHSDWVSSIAKGNNLSVKMEGRAHAISLRGTSAAILKVKECVSRRGQVISTLQGSQVNQFATPPIESDAARMGTGCPAYGSMRSPNTQDWGDVNFTNRTDRAVTIYWIDFQGQNVEMGGLLPGESQSLTSNAGHLFLAKDFGGTCFGGVWTVGYGNNNFEIYEN